MAQVVDISIAVTARALMDCLKIFILKLNYVH